MARLIACAVTLAAALRPPARTHRPPTRLRSWKIDQQELDSPLEPLANYMLVEVDPTSETSGGGIVLTGSAKEPASTGTVVSVGPGRVEGESGVLLPVQCSPGDRVMWGRYSGADVNYNNKGHTLLKDRDVQMFWDGDLTAATARPIGGNLLIRITENTGETAGGLLLGLAAQDKLSLIGEVVQTGPGPLLRDGSRGEMPAAVGDSVRFRDFDVTEVDLDGEDYVLVGAEHIMMKWTAQS
mmetsp:Transcript_23696/g.71080  ORF Transcript_23696/g.71080 Transcript_23696/m.71080 type:complete len:240 (+) Transcript_23696:161-880(+)